MEYNNVSTSVEEARKINEEIELFLANCGDLDRQETLEDIAGILKNARSSGKEYLKAFCEIEELCSEFIS